MDKKNKFIELLVKLEPVEFLGVARVLCIDIMDDSKPRDFYEILNDMVNKFDTLGRSQRRQIFSVIKKAGKTHVSNTEN